VCRVNIPTHVIDRISQTFNPFTMLALVPDPHERAPDLRKLALVKISAPPDMCVLLIWLVSRDKITRKEIRQVVGCKCIGRIVSLALRSGK